MILCLVGVAAIMFRIYLFYRESRKVEPAEPITEDILKQYDDLPSGIAIYLAWVDGTNQNTVRAEMPILARALDRMVEED